MDKTTFHNNYSRTPRRNNTGFLLTTQNVFSWRPGYRLAEYTVCLKCCVQPRESLEPRLKTPVHYLPEVLHAALQKPENQTRDLSAYVLRAAPRKSGDLAKDLSILLSVACSPEKAWRPGLRPVHYTISLPVVLHAAPGKPENQARDLSAPTGLIC
ncbi:hypothetical protein Bbelb_299820 [Branchiostoma belcheri]|nr:hypothetical protein Bbelb_299820 [Branchiostoma belcheri]